MKIATYIDRLWSGLKAQPNQFDRHSVQTKNTIRAAAACTLAIFLALLLQAQNPFWSAISAFIVSQSNIGSTVFKSSLRFSGTIIGALLAVILAGLFIHQRLLYAVLIYGGAFIGIYMSMIDRKHMYAWLLGYVTLLMVMIPSMQNGTPQHIIFLAFYRSLEIIIGIAAGLVATYTIFPDHAEHHLVELTTPLVDELQRFVDEYIKSLSQPTQATELEQFEQQIKKLLPALDKLNEHIEHNHYELGARQQHQLFRQYATIIYQAFSVLIEVRRQYVIDQQTAECCQYFAPLLTTLHQRLSGIIETSYRLISKQTEPAELSQQLQQFRSEWRALKRHYQTNRPQLKQNFSIETINHFIQLTLTIKLITYPFEKLCITPRQKAPPILDKPKTPWYNKLFAYDTFYLKHAAVGAAAILVVPIVWMAFAFPGFQQIAISIAASIGMTGQGTQYKGFLRLTGCLAGAAIALLCLGLDIDSTALFLGLIFLVSIGFLYFHYGPTTISYFGTQAAVVFYIGFANALHPTTSTIAGIERLEGIFLGVLSIVFFQWLFWSFSPLKQLRHHLKQIKVALYYPTYLMQQAICRPESIDIPDWCTTQLAEMRLAIRQIDKIEQPQHQNTAQLNQACYQHCRNLYRHIYSYLILQAHATDLNQSLLLAPTLKTNILQLLDVFNTRHHTEENITNSQAKLQSILQKLQQARLSIRQDQKKTEQQPIYAIFDTIALMNTTTALCQNFSGFLDAMQALLQVDRRAQPSRKNNAIN